MILKSKRSTSKQADESGFSMVELIIGLVIAGIVAAVAMSRFTDGNAFNAIIVRDQLIAMIRTAQQSALGRSNVALTLTPNASASSLTVVRSDDGGTVDTVSVNLDSVSLSGDINVTASCGSVNGQTAIASGSPLAINFAELGALGDSGVGSVSTVVSGLRICLNNDPVFSVCVSPSGFAYAGDCDD